MTEVVGEKSARQRQLWIEVCFVLLVCIAPWMYSSNMDAWGLVGRPAHVFFVYHAWSVIIRSAGTVAVVMFVILRSREPFSRFGVKKFRALPDLLGGVGIWGVFFLLMRAFYLLQPYVPRTLFGHGYGRAYDLPADPAEYVLLVLCEFANGFAEESVVRAYLITRLEELLESTPAAVVVSTAIFAGYHSYQGAFSMVGVGIVGLVQAMAFCKFRRLTPVAVSHGIQDCVVIFSRLPVFS